MADPRHAGNSQRPALRRVLTLWPLTFYGLGVIVGAGIYVAIGSVIGRAGEAAPMSFLLSGVAAALVGLCYAELASRFPEAAGSAAYVRHGFNSKGLAIVAGVLVTATAALSAASIAHGAAAYLLALLPTPPAALVLLLIGASTVIAASGVQASVGIAAALGLMEVAGLIAATVAGLWHAPAWHLHGLVPISAGGWAGTLAGAFIAFFAFIGFETLANLAEETKDPGHTVPRGILAAVAVSMLLYTAVAAAVVLSHQDADDTLLGLFRGVGVQAFAVIGSLAVANGTLVQIVMLARLFYGMASQGELPAVLARVYPRTGTPMVATLLAGGIVATAAAVATFEQLLVATNVLTLAVFLLVALALWRVRRAGGPPPAFVAPIWVPPAAAMACLALLLAEAFSG